MKPETRTIEDIKKAVNEAQSELATDLRAFNLHLFPDQISASYGGWLLPAECHGSSALRKSYELHKLVEKVEERLQDLTGATVTVDLLASAGSNGR